MRFLLTTLLTLAIGFIAGMFLPWWSIAIAAFIVAAAWPQGAGRSFLSGFLGMFLLWGLLALWIDIKNEGLLGSKVASLFGIGDSSILMVLLTGFVAGLVGGLGALSGSLLRKL